MGKYNPPFFNQVDAVDLIGTLRQTEGGIGGFLFNSNTSTHARYGFTDADIDEITMKLANEVHVSEEEDRALELHIIHTILESKLGKARNEVLKSKNPEGAHAEMKM